MADFAIDTAELDAFARQLAAAGVELADLETPNDEAGRVVLAAARPPHLTGTLGSSLTAGVTANGVVFASTARYWTFVHWGAPRRNIKARPFLAVALEAATDQVVAVYADHAKRVLT